MTDPIVSFIVPCYNLAHLLPECVNSILGQTFEDFEVLIMDDKSPDNTAEVASAFTDPRVKHIRNDPNLGHLRNYNKGIGLARGKYVWLISADDYLRRPYVLQRYVELLERHKNIGYVFCPAVGVLEGKETGVLSYSACWKEDKVVSGHAFLDRLLLANLVPAASGLVRRECYEKISVFPLDMPWAGDWYLWSLFALYHDVGFLSEAMVCYREHPLSMTKHLTDQQIDACSREEVSIPWAIKKLAAAAGFTHLKKTGAAAAANVYVRTIAYNRFKGSSAFMDMNRFEESLSENTQDEAERTWIRARVYAGIGNACYARGDRAAAKDYYDRALQKDPWMPKVRLKRMLLSSGRIGDRIWNTLKAHS
jgi:glycosyltransferase involved in cell wall biosynthesis